jgi:type IV secretory pathway VirB10-like protein
MPQTIIVTGRRRFRGATALVSTALLALSMSACMRARAQALPEVPLDVPEAPPRMVDVRDPAETPIMALPEEPPRNTPVIPRPTPPVPRTESRPAEPRPEPEPPLPPDEASRTPALQTTPALQEGEAERRVRAQLSQATTALNRINTQALNADARLQFDTARRFVAQAEEALRSRNLVFAANLAEKAMALAEQLSTR